MFEVKISVRNLVEFVCRTGDIDTRKSTFSDHEAMQEGSRIHRKIQGRMGPEYTPEVPLKIIKEYENYRIIVEGRADGIISKPSGIIIDEIKGMYYDVTKLKSPIAIHTSQAMCYAYIYATLNSLSKIKIQLTYCDLDTESIKRFKEEYCFEELSEWFESVINNYKKWVDMLRCNTEKRQNSITNLEFPFEYRAGQKSIVVSVYKSAIAGENLYIQAPTGVGKTMSVLFPAVRSLGENKGDKIFYLTAKTITRTVAEEAFDIMRKNGLHFKNVTITAKEKLCILDKSECNPEKCERAKGHYDRINDAVYDVLTHESSITREIISEYATKHCVCPFEMNLDCTNWSDGIICDYNYVYDPNVRLKRYFSDGMKGEYIVLVDEAHNLVDRARTMYSATLSKQSILSMRRLFKDKSKAVYNSLSKCNSDFLKFKRESEDSDYSELENADELVKHLLRLQGYMKRFLEDNKEFDERIEVIDFYFDVLNFLNIYELVDGNYVIYTQSEGKETIIRLYCVNPSGNIGDCMGQCRTTVFFSATLLPVNYYKEMLSGRIKDNAIYINSPFSQEKRLIFIGNDVSSMYKRRNITEYQKIAEYIRITVSKSKGNYMVFFPSYSFMENVFDILEPFENIDNINYIMQESNMNENERESFLGNFREDSDGTLVGMCVLGGIFSEGIDLKNDRLIGVLVVGTGLPMVCTENEILKKYFEKKGKNGFDYAYRFQGMNKVLQAAGRVIRTAEDYGVIGLLDERFLQSSYTNLYPREWNDCKVVNINKVDEEIKRFWKYL